MVSAGSYILSAALLAALTLSLATSAVLLRRRLLPQWQGAPAYLVDAIVGIALLVWLSELLGVLGLFYARTLVTASVLLAGAIAWRLRSSQPSEPPPPGSGVGVGGPAPPEGFGGEGPDPASAPPLPPEKREGQGEPPTPTTGAARPGGPATGPAGPGVLALLVTIGVVALVFAQWGLTTADALNRGIFNFDSLWYHMPFAVEMAQSHSVTGLHYTETVFTNWFYPQNSELLHAVGILLTERDTLSLFLNFGWLAIAFLAAWCVGRPYGRGHLAVVAVAIMLASHTLVVREPGAAKNDVMAAALLLAAIAILVNGWADARGKAPGPRVPSRRKGGAAGEGVLDPPSPSHAPAAGGAPPLDGWPLAAAGLATGLAVGTKSTALAMAAVLTLAAIALAPAGRRLAAAAWWFLPALAGGGYWYLRNLVAVGNPLPQLESLGPISLPHPERLQSGRPDFSVAHYAFDTGVWSEYFGPELDQAFGVLWPVVVAAAVAGGLVALLWGRERVLRWMGGVALFGLVAYLFTPLTAAGAEGAPEGFGINIRYAVPALLAGLALLALALPPSDRSLPTDVPLFRGHYGYLSCGTSRWRGVLWWLPAALLLALLVVTDRSDAVLRDPDRLFAWPLALLLVLVPAGLLIARGRGVSRRAVTTGFVALALAVLAIGYAVQRDYLDDRFRNADPATSIPGMRLDSAYRWARDVEDARIGLAGTTAGFLGYGFYGTDLSNEVSYLGRRGSHGAFNAIPDCAGFRAAVNAADLDYLVTSPFLNFIDPADPVASPEAGWLRGEPAVKRIRAAGPVAVWRVRGRLDPGACGTRNAPLRYLPQQPG